MSGKNMNFNDKKIKKSDFHKNKKIAKADDPHVNKISVSKKNHTVQRINLNTLLNIIIMMLSDHYL